MENHVSLMNEVPNDGCLVLGQEGPSYNTYNTRYYVDRKERRAHLNSDILLEPCVPCCMAKNQSSAGKAVWSVLSSQSFLLFMHVLVLTIGVSKECFRLRDLEKSLHFYQSLVETILTTVQLIIRLISVWLAFRNLKLSVITIEFVDEDLSVRGRCLRKIIVFYIATILSIAVGNIAIFPIFHRYSHLGWTILTNNVALLTVMLLTAVLNHRLSQVERQMEKDDHNLILCETLLLLRESFMLQSSEERQDYLMRVERFLTAYKNTPYFAMPSHIRVLKEHVPDWNLYSSSEHITVV